MMYAVGHNISSFDSIEVLHTILQDQEKYTLTSLLKSNGRYITFTLQVGDVALKFINSFLFTNDSLASVAKALGLQTQKLSLSHRYLQNVPTWDEALRRLNSYVSWADLGSYMDWFEGMKNDDLQSRINGRTHDQWIQETAVFREWEAKKSFRFNFKTAMETYLNADVEIVQQIVNRLGKSLADKYGINIGNSMTAGSHAVHIW